MPRTNDNQDRQNDAKLTETDGSVVNRVAWNGQAYAAWIERFGRPEDAAQTIRANPHKMLTVLKDKFGEVHGKRVLNLMGSNGSKAVALALLGAKVTVVDFSAENRRYALELAAAAGVEIEYFLADVLHLKESGIAGNYDLIFAEMGILHYFTDLHLFMDIAADFLSVGGRFVLRDFHPVSTKLISYRGSTAKVRKYKITGDYFDTSLEKSEVAFSKHLDLGQMGQATETVLLRKWTMGEIVTALAQAGLVIKSLSEEPNLSSDSFDKGIPKTFTIVAEKPLFPCT